MPRPAKRSRQTKDVAQYLLNTFHKLDLGHIFAEVAAVYPDVISAISAPAVELEAAKKPEGQTLEDSWAQLRTPYPSESTPQPVQQDSVVQFSSAVYFCDEEEGQVLIDVIRIGPMDKACSVEFSTEDASAQAGLKYVATSGVLHFNPGDDSQTFEVKLINNSTWDATLEFVVRLSNCKNVGLGRYLYKSRVRIIDDDCFPSSKYKQILKEDRIKDIPKLQLLMDYFKMNWRYGKFCSRAALLMLYGQLLNLIQVGSLFVGIWLVDVLTAISQGGEEDQSRVNILILAGVILGLAVVRRFLETMKVEAKAAGDSRRLLQTNTIRKFLNYEENVRVGVRESEVVNVITRDSVRLVSDGLMINFEIFRQTSLLVVLFAFQVWNSAQSSFDAFSTFMYLLPSIAFPAVMLLILVLRQSRTIRAHAREHDMLMELTEHVRDVVENVQLIIGFQQRPVTLARIDQTIKRMNEAIFEKDLTNNINLSFGPLLASLLTAAYVLYGAGKIAAGEDSVGKVLALLSSIQMSAGSFGKIYEQCLQVERAFPALLNLTHHMNLPVDLSHRLRSNRRNRQSSKKSSKNNASSMAGADWDRQKLKFRDICFAYSSAVSGEGTSLGPWSLQVEQGSMVGLCGGHGDGKTTLLKLIGSILLPTSGECFVPPHLRVYYVSQTPLFFLGTLYENLICGSDLEQCHDDASSSARVFSICRQLGVADYIIDKGDADTNQFAALSASEKMALHLSRALISNPEVLVMARPMSVFTDDQSTALFNMMRRHISERGLGIDEPGQSYSHLRRPRTIIFTTQRLGCARHADKVYMVNKHSTMQLESSEVSDTL